MPDKYAQMHARLLQLGNGTYQTDYIQPGLQCLDPYQAKTYYKGFRGPLCFNGSAPVVPPAPKPMGFQLRHATGGLCLTGDRKLRLAACDKTSVPQWIVGNPKTKELQSATST